MSFRFSLRSIERCRSVDPRLMAVCVVALSRSPVDFGVTEEQSRTVAEQAAKVKAGVSKTMNSKHMIPEGGSFSVAIDLVPFIDGRFQWGDDKWQVRRADGLVIEPFYAMAAAMRDAAVATGFRIRWGGAWDRTLNDLPPGADAMRRAVAEYVVRHAGPDFLDGPHFELTA